MMTRERWLSFLKEHPSEMLALSPSDRADLANVLEKPHVPQRLLNLLHTLHQHLPHATSPELPELFEMLEKTP